MPIYSHTHIANSIRYYKEAMHYMLFRLLIKHAYFAHSSRMHKLCTCKNKCKVI